MTQSTNYCSRLNRDVKVKSQRWTVRAIYQDASLNVAYIYRTERGAQAQLAYLTRMIQVDAERALGCEVPMIAATIESC